MRHARCACVLCSVRFCPAYLGRPQVMTLLEGRAVLECGWTPWVAARLLPDFLVAIFNNCWEIVFINPRRRRVNQRIPLPRRLCMRHTWAEPRNGARACCLPPAESTSHSVTILLTTSSVHERCRAARSDYAPLPSNSIPHRLSCLA